MTLTTQLKQRSVNLKHAFQFAATTPKHVTAALTATTLSFTVFVGLTFPAYTIELLTAGIQYWDTAFTELLWLLRASSGVLGVLLVGIYAAVTGVLIVVVTGSMYHQSTGETGLLTIAPGVLLSGCAGCGAGLLGVIGAFGYASIFPFNGNLIRFLGIFLVVGVLAHIGNPRTCTT